MLTLRQSTATTVRIGPFVDVFDGVTEQTELGDMDVEIAKGSGAFAVRNSSTEITHDSEGWYAVPLDVTDTNTPGILKLKAQNSEAHLPVWEAYLVLPPNVYDSIVLGSDNLYVDVRQVAGVVAGDVYHADVNLTIDDVNNVDEYTVAWFKNGVRITTGIESASLRVIKRADGTDLVAISEMAPIASTGIFKLNEADNRMMPGEPAAAIVTAQIGGQTRTFMRLVSRDSH